MSYYTLFIYGKPWSTNGTPVFDNLTDSGRAIDLARSCVKNDERIDKVEVWEFEGQNDNAQPQLIHTEGA